jgi:phosphoribosylformylglycinamidine synthase
VGARPCAATNCLNFGNPEKPEVMWQFSRAVDGIAEACHALAIPITGGNVSFYNDTLGKSIDPTPILGVLGVLEDESRVLTMAFRNEGDAIVLLDGRGGDSSALRAGEELTLLREFYSSEYVRSIIGGVGPDTAAAVPPAIDLAAEARLIEALVALAGEGLLASAHDLSDGGLAVALAECAFASAGLSAEADVESPGPAALVLFAETLFGETGARAVVTVPESSLAQLRIDAAKYGVAARVIGRVTRGEFHIRQNGVTVIRDTAANLRGIWSGALESAVLAHASVGHSVPDDRASSDRASNVRV